MALADGCLSGQVLRHCDADDKAAFIAGVCAARGVPPSAAAMVGDSRSDLPSFRVCGLSIALNGDQAARAAATTSLSTDDLRAVLPLLS